MEHLGHGGEKWQKSFAAPNQQQRHQQRHMTTDPSPVPRMGNGMEEEEEEEEGQQLATERVRG
jgi:hypothetical protein